MKAIALLAAAASLALVVGVVVFAPKEASAEVTMSETPAMTTASRHAIRAAYRARLATQGTPSAVAEKPPVCPEGFVHWKRGIDVELCTNTCASDLECLAAERCRVLSAKDGPQQRFRFAAEHPIHGNERVLGLCDPFWDYEGVVSAVPFPVGDTEEDYGFTNEVADDDSDAGVPLAE